jgi:outer membrane biosynthesis protein TonB
MSFAAIILLSLLMPEPELASSIDKELIRRIVRQNIDDVRGCYETALASDPDVSGKVVIQFVIDADGTIDSSTVTSNNTGDVALGDCIANRVLRWTFPTFPGGSKVTINYPFVLEPG